MCRKIRNKKNKKLTIVYMEQTLSIIKPDALKNNLTREINNQLEQSGLKIIAQKKILLTKKQAQDFYAVHKKKPFFNNLITFMISGPVIVQVLEGNNAVTKSRNVIGDTNPKNAQIGTIRQKFAKSIEENVVHGSDSVENAQKEIAFFFNDISC